MGGSVLFGSTAVPEVPVDGLGRERCRIEHVRGELDRVERAPVNGWYMAAVLMLGASLIERPRSPPQQTLPVCPTWNM